MDGARPPNGMQHYDNQPLDTCAMLTHRGTQAAFVYKFLQSYYKKTGFQNIFCQNANIFEKLAFRTNNLFNESSFLSFLKG